jgi:hypothetical protein
MVYTYYSNQARKSITKKSSGQFKASRFLRSKKARPFKLRADLGVRFQNRYHIMVCSYSEANKY